MRPAQPPQPSLISVCGGRPSPRPQSHRTCGERPNHRPEDFLLMQAKRRALAERAYSAVDILPLCSLERIPHPSSAALPLLLMLTIRRPLLLAGHS